MYSVEISLEEDGAGDSLGGLEMERTVETERLYRAKATSWPLSLVKRVEQIVGPLEERRFRPERRNSFVKMDPDRRRMSRREGGW